MAIVQSQEQNAFGERFLDQPDLFPARQSGETWGEESLAVHIAGNAYVCAGLNVAQAAAIRQRFDGLCRRGDEASNDVVPLTIFRGAPTDYIVDERSWDF